MSILQTPLNVEKGKKRDAEAATPLSGSSDEPGAKKKKLNPLPEMESFQEILDIQGREDSQQTCTGCGTSTNFQRKELQRQQSAEISCFKPPIKYA